MLKIIIQRLYNPKLFHISHETAVYSIDCPICSNPYDYWCTSSSTPPPLEPSVTAERLDDNSLKVSWDNIRSDNNFYGIIITESGTDNLLALVSSSTSEFTFTHSHEHFERVSNADRVGISGTVDGEVVDERFVPVPDEIPQPSVTVERLADNSLKVSWENIRLEHGNYVIRITESGTVKTLSILNPDTSEFTFLPSHSFFDRVNNAEEIGIVGRDASNAFIDQRLAPVPDEIACTDLVTTEPCVTAERLADNSIKVSWENIRTHEFFIVFNFFVINGDTETDVDFIPEGVVSSFTFSPTHDNFNQINDADSVGVAGTIDGESVDKTFADVPPRGTVTAVRLADDSIELTWENIRTNAAEDYGIRITEGVTDSAELVAVPSSDSTFTFSPSDDLYQRVSNAQRVGVHGTVDGESSDQSWIAVPATTLPTVTAVRLADNSILVTWSNIPTDRNYDLKMIKDGAIDTIQVRIDAESFTILTTHGKFDRINNADSLGVNGIAGTSSTPTHYIPVPDEIACTDRVPVEPCVTAVRLADNTLRIDWTNIRTDNNFYDIRLTESDTDKTLFPVRGNTDHYRFPVGNSFFDRVNSAERIGISGSIGGERVDERFVAVPAQIPSLSVERLADDSIKLTWSNIRTDDTYGIRIAGTDSAELVNVPSTESTFTFEPSDDLFERVNNAQRIGVNGFSGDAAVDLTFEPVPAPTLPTLKAERLADGSIKLTWSNIRTDNNRYDIRTAASGSGIASTLLPVASDTSEFTFEPSDEHFKRVNNAERIGITGYDNGIRVDQEWVAVPAPNPPPTPQPAPKVTAERLADNSILVSWENIPTDRLYSIAIIEDGVGSVVEHNVAASPHTFPLSHRLFDRVSNADEIGVVADISGVTTTPTFTSVPDEIACKDRVTVEPCIEAVRLDDNSIELTWQNIPTSSGHAFLSFKGDVRTSITELMPTNPFTISPSDPKFERVNNADEIAVAGYIGNEIALPLMFYVSVPDEIKSKGGSDKWKTKPTFGNSWSTQTQLVDAGFVFNGIPLTITDNWHTDFDLTSSIIGENNIVHIKGYASNDFKSVTLSLGIPEIGKKYDAESHIILNLNRNYTTPSDYQITEIIHDQKEGLVNESMTSATLSKAKCTPADVVKQCIDFEISFVMMAPLTGEVLAISAMDNEYRETVTFINQGVEFVGESLLESQTHVLTQKYSNQHKVETIELTQLDRRYQMWEDQNGYLWTQNEYGSWLQITIPDIIQRDDPATSVMTRNHSNFAGMVTQEQDRAVLVFNSLEIQGIPDEPFAHDIPLRLEKLSDPEVLEILHIQALLAEELICDCILLED